MQTKEDLTKLYSSFSNAQLFDILNEKDQYTEIALSVASEEIQKRNLKESHVKEYVDNKVIEAKTAKYVAAIELTLFEKLGFFFLWLLPFFIEAATKINLVEAGLKTKVTQSRIFSSVGFLTFMLTGFLGAIFNHSDIQSILLWILFFVLTYFIENKFRKAKKRQN